MHIMTKSNIDHIPVLGTLSVAPEKPKMARVLNDALELWNAGVTRVYTELRCDGNPPPRGPSSWK